MKYEFHVGDYVETNGGKRGYIFRCDLLYYRNILISYILSVKYDDWDYAIPFEFREGDIEKQFNRIGKYDFAWLRAVRDCGYAEKDEVDKMRFTKLMMMPGNLHEGDYVETADGRVGYVKGICRCEKCRERGFYEPIVHFTDGEEDCITKYEAENGFKGYKRIGRWENEKAVVKKPKDIFHCGSVWKSENGTMRYVPDTQVMQDKINELIDAVNELRKEKQK